MSSTWDSVFNTGPCPSDALSAGASDQPLAVPVRSTVALDGRLQTLYEHMVRVSRVGKPRSKVTWRSILGAHLKPAKANGGRIVDGDIKDMLEVQVSSQAHARLTIPNSFRKGDGAAVGAEGIGENQQEAVEMACALVFCKLLACDAVENHPSQLVLHPINWVESKEQLLLHARSILTEPLRSSGAQVLTGQPLAPAPVARPLADRKQRRSSDMYERPANAEVRKAECVQLLRQICEVEGGIAVASRLQKIPTPRGVVSAWVELARLFQPGTLVAFLNDPANGFECIRQKQTGSAKGTIAFRVRDIAIGQPLATHSSKSYYSDFSGGHPFATSLFQPMQEIEVEDANDSSQVEGQEDSPLRDRSTCPPIDCLLGPDAATEDFEALMDEFLSEIDGAAGV
jgi:hypothetical protein